MATGDKALASRFNAIVTNINTVKAYNTSYVPSGQTWQGTVKTGDKMTAASVNQLISNIIALSNKVEGIVGGSSSSCTTHNCSSNNSGYTASRNSHSNTCNCNGLCNSDQHYCPVQR